MKKMKRVIPVFLMLILMSALVYADDYQDGENAYRRGDYRTAFEKFMPLAEQGDAQSQWLVCRVVCQRYGKLFGIMCKPSNGPLLQGRMELK